ncbi:hypothetical protein OU426_00780 [Frigidibacter sp. RF13]|nr:hypothetical protein [Frigidibacter sp. RF13]MCY1125376.1 hypothetical protein [Frigidibacter sp. RF13]
MTAYQNSRSIAESAVIGAARLVLMGLTSSALFITTGFYLSTYWMF